MRISKSDNSIHRINLIYSGKNTEVSVGNIPCVFKKIKNKDDFRREMYVYLISKHDNVLKYYHINSLDQIITMEFCEMSLFHRIYNPNKKEIPDKIKLKYIGEIIDGMIYLHEDLKVLHGDIKPANCLISKKRIKLCDFGHSVKINNFNPCNLFGTANYILPDLIKEKKIDNPKIIDIYAFGLLVWELYTRKIPFENIGGSYKILSKFKKSNEEIIVDLDIIQNPKIKTLIKNCLRKKYKSFIEIKKFLQKV